MDAASLQGVCDSFSSLHGVAIKIFDTEGAKIVDAKAESGLCAYVFAFPRGRMLCTNLVGEIKTTEADREQATTLDCFTGNRYRIVPIRFDLEYLGKIVFGPFFPADLAGLPEPLVQLDSRINREELDAYAAQYRRLAEEESARIVDTIARVLDVLLFTGYRTHLASAMHLEAISESYRELNDKNRKLQESFDRLKELDRLKSNFLATVSHELRTPLTSVIGYSEMLLDGLAGSLTQEQREYVQTIMEKGENLLQMITSILDVSKIEQSQLKLSPTEFQVEGLVDEAIAVVRPLSVRRRQALQWTVESPLPPLDADKDKVRQVLVNLLGNAVKFTPDGGSIRVVVDLASMPGGRPDEASELFSPFAGRAVRFRVVDTGIGIPDDRQEKIFDIFYQVDNSSTREYGGCGLGLSIVKSFVEAHGGRVMVESVVGRGSTFAAYFPILREDR